MQTKIPCVLMRGGTSKGPFFLASDLPADTALRDAVLLAAMGSPDNRQIDGVGGADPLTSKVAIVTGEGRGSGQGIDLALAENRPRYEGRNNAKATVNLPQRRETL